MDRTFVKYQLSLSELTLDLHHTAPLLGYGRELPEDILPMVSEVMNETIDCFDICGGYQLFDQIGFMEGEKNIRIENTEFKSGKIIHHQLKHSEQIAVFVCTAGEQISHWSKQMMTDDPLRGFIADILGSVVVEAAMETVQQKLSDDMVQQGLKITNRYSPGYCGWHVSEQHKLFGLLPKGVCNITLTESSLMIPIKSVSGFIGIGTNVHFNPYTCQLCEATHCVYRFRKLPPPS